MRELGLQQARKLAAAARQLRLRAALCLGSRLLAEGHATDAANRCQAGATRAARCTWPALAELHAVSAVPRASTLKALNESSQLQAHGPAGVAAPSASLGHAGAASTSAEASQRGVVHGISELSLYSS